MCIRMNIQNHIHICVYKSIVHAYMYRERERCVCIYTQIDDQKCICMYTHSQKSAMFDPPKMGGSSL